MIRFLNRSARLRGGGGARREVQRVDRRASVPAVPCNEPMREPLAGSEARAALVRELTALCREPPALSLMVAGESGGAGDLSVQSMPFDHRRVAAFYHHAWPETLTSALVAACGARRDWERSCPKQRVAVFERAAALMAGQRRARVLAAAIVGQGMTAAQAERDLCRLVDHVRFGCRCLRDLARNTRLVRGGDCAFDCKLYHGIEGFWAAITPYSSFATAAQLAITPALMGNCVVWKPSDRAVLACHRVHECLLEAGMPPNVIGLMPAEERLFLELVCSDRRLAGVTFAGTTTGLECVCRSVGERVESFAHFPRVVGTGSAKNFHVVHASADLNAAVACTVRAAFEYAGQNATACSRVYVAKSIMKPFTELLKTAVEAIVVSHPLDYRCFMSALTSVDAFDKVGGWLERLQRDDAVRLVAGGHTEGRVGYFVAPTVVQVRDATHPLLEADLRGPVLALCEFHDADRDDLVDAIAHAPFACTGAIFTKDREWGTWAVEALREVTPTLFVNQSCAEERPGCRSVGGMRKSGIGLKVGSEAYVLQFATERSLSEAARPARHRHVTARYMNECPPRLRHAHTVHLDK